MLADLDRKIELGQNLKFIVDKHGFKRAGLSQNLKDALKTYELHSETNEEDMYKCTFCDYATKKKFDVKKHEKTRHFYHE